MLTLRAVVLDLAVSAYCDENPTDEWYEEVIYEKTNMRFN